jgi:ABC-type branched-subunit amino acid transport system permease subunit
VLIFGIVFIVTVLFLPKGLVGIVGIVRKPKKASAAAQEK